MPTEHKDPTPNKIVTELYSDWRLFGFRSREWLNDRQDTLHPGTPLIGDHTWETFAKARELGHTSWKGLNRTDYEYLDRQAAA